MSSSRGSVLVLVLWILVIISFLSGEYISHNREKSAVVLHTTEAFKRETAAFSVLELLASAQYDLIKIKAQEENGYMDTIVAKTDLNSTTPKNNNSDKTLFGTDNAANSVATTDDSALSWITLRPGGVEVWVKVENESSKIQLSLALEQNIRTTVQNIYGEELTEEADRFADALLDWLDPDDLVRENGAEKPYYNDTYPPCDPADGPFKSMTEIFMVKDFSYELFWGSPYQYILELPTYSDLKEQEIYELNRRRELNKNRAKNRTDSADLDSSVMQTILERFTIYPKDYIRVSMLFPEEGDRWYNEIFWLKKVGGSFQLVEQLSRIMVVNMSFNENR